MALLWQEIVRIAARLEPEMQREFLAAVDRLRATVPASVVADAIARRTHIQAALPLLEESLEPSVDVLRRGFQMAASKAASRVRALQGMSMRFDITNPFAVTAAREMAATYVTRISQTTRQGIRAIITQSIQEGLTYRDAARLIRPMVGLTESQVRAVLNFRRSLLALNVKRDTATIRTRQYVQRQLRDRAMSIARTELMAASNAGQDSAWMQAIEQGRMPPDQKKEWLVTPDDRLCPRCRAMRGQRVGVGQRFAMGGPPLHPRCRCTIVLAMPGARRRALA